MSLPGLLKFHPLRGWAPRASECRLPFRKWSGPQCVHTGVQQYRLIGTSVNTKDVLVVFLCIVYKYIYIVASKEMTVYQCRLDNNPKSSNENRINTAYALKKSYKNFQIPNKPKNVLDFKYGVYLNRRTNGKCNTLYRYRTILDSSTQGNPHGINGRLPGRRTLTG